MGRLAQAAASWMGEILDGKHSSARHADDGTGGSSCPLLAAGLVPSHAARWWTDHPVRRAVAVTLTALLAFTCSFAAAAVHDVSSRISKTAVPTSATASAGTVVGRAWSPVDQWAGRPIDVLVLGQDTRAGEANAAIGGGDPGDADNHQADTAMIVHVSADREMVTVVSLPRDSIVDQPECEVTGGRVAAARSDVMLNSTFAYGWQQGGDLASAVSCELATVDAETGLDLQQYVVVDFAGMKDVIDSLGGVELCVPAAVDDPYTGLRLSPGLQKLDGVQATQYARVRHGIAGADGGDIMRTARQQAVVKALVDEAAGAARSANPVKLYQMAARLLDSVKMSPDLASPSTLVGLAWSLRNVSFDKIESMTVPTVPWSQDANRVTWGDGAGGLWAKLAADEPLDGGQSSVAAGAGDDAGGQAPQDTASTGDSTHLDVDPATGLSTVDGELVDPVTGGRVDPETGYIMDRSTGSVIGLASKYLSTTVCKPAA